MFAIERNNCVPGLQRSGWYRPNSVKRHLHVCDSAICDSCKDFSWFHCYQHVCFSIIHSCKLDVQCSKSFLEWTCMVQSKLLSSWLPSFCPANFQHLCPTWLVRSGEMPLSLPREIGQVYLAKHFFECGKTQAWTCHISDSCTGIDNSIVAHHVRTGSKQVTWSVWTQKAPRFTSPGCSKQLQKMLHCHRWAHWH